MKRLITLFASAFLLCPVWAGAQSTTPSISKQLHYSGNLVVGGVMGYYLVYPTYGCRSITDLRLIILSSNGLSPIKYVSGYFNCTPQEPGVEFLAASWSTFSGALVAAGGDNLPLPISGGDGGRGYLGNFTLGLALMRCSFSFDLTQANCNLYGVDSVGPSPLGTGYFTYTSAP